MQKNIIITATDQNLYGRDCLHGDNFSRAKQSPNKSMKLPTLLRLCVAVCVAGIFSGCASTKVTMDSNYGGKLPRPDQILIYNFAVSPDEVELDSGISGDIQQLINQTPRTDQERAIGRSVADALANHLVSEIEKLGFIAVRSYGSAPSTGNSLAIKGQFISIDEGNQAERVVIGLGLGRTDVRTVVQAYDLDYGKKILVSQFGVNSRSGSGPGMAETMGVGALTGRLATSAVVSSGVQVGTEAFSANVNADADRTAKAIANELKKYFVNQGWILQ
jgi:Domain of unknown function (DUF4410)